MAVKFANNATATLASAITSTTTSITVSAGQGALFPSLAAGDFFFATLVDSSNNIEIVRCTTRSGDTLTVVRGQDGTMARAYASLDKIELRVTAGALNNKVDADTPTVIGNVAVTKSNPTIILTKSAAAQGAQIQAFNGASQRWAIDLADNASETGSNAGSNFDVLRYSDSNLLLDVPFTINRANGSGYFTQPLYVQGNMVFHAGNLPPKLDSSGGTISGNLAVTGTVGATGLTTLTDVTTSGFIGVNTTTRSSPVTVKASAVDGIAVRVLESSGGSGSLQFANDPVTTQRAIITALNTGELRITAGLIAFSPGGTTHAGITSTGTFQFNSGYGSSATAYGVRAWANFSGLGSTGAAQTIRANGNISSISKVGTGSYTVNFATAMPDTNYAVFVGRARPDANMKGGVNEAAITTTSVGIFVGVGSDAMGGGAEDASFIYVSVVR
jgi:hypothetical protein